MFRIFNFINILYRILIMFVFFLSFLMMPFNVVFVFELFVFKYHLFCNYFLFILASCLFFILFLYYMFERGAILEAQTPAPLQSKF